MQKLKDFLEQFSPYTGLIFESHTISMMVCDEGISVKNNSDDDILLQYLKPDAMEKMGIDCDWERYRIEIYYDNKPILVLKFLSFYATNDVEIENGS